MNRFDRRELMEVVVDFIKLVPREKSKVKLIIRHRLEGKPSVVLAGEDDRYNEVKLDLVLPETFTPNKDSEFEWARASLYGEANIRTWKQWLDSKLVPQIRSWVTSNYKMLEFELDEKGELGA